MYCAYAGTKPSRVLNWHGLGVVANLAKLPVSFPPLAYFLTNVRPYFGQEHLFRGELPAGHGHCSTPYYRELHAFLMLSIIELKVCVSSDQVSSEPIKDDCLFPILLVCGNSRDYHSGFRQADQMPFELGVHVVHAHLDLPGRERR